MTPANPGAVDNGTAYPARFALAEAWSTAAERDLRTGRWLPTDLERVIAEEITRTARDPGTRWPPFDDEPMHRRLQRLARWAAAVRLGLMAGGWPPPSAAEVKELTTDTLVDLPGLLTGVYGPLELWEQWHHERNWTNDNAEQADAQLTRKIPNLLDLLDRAEPFYDFGIGTTLTAVVTGDVS